MPKPIPHCSNFVKIVFFGLGGGQMPQFEKFKNTGIISDGLGNLNPDVQLEIQTFVFYHPMLTPRFEFLSHCI